MFRKKKLNDDNRIIVDDPNFAYQIEGYTRLKDNVLFMNVDGKNQVLQIESSVQHEGKTTVLSNLAVALGMTEKKVAVVDLDFRRPRLHRAFKLSKSVGVSDYILGDCELKDIIKNSGHKNVDVITCGDAMNNPTLILVSDKFKAFIKELREKYDFILLDCAPVLQVSDYIHISKVSDGVIFCVAYAMITKAQVSEAVRELRKNNVNILGSVFSMYDKKKDKSLGLGGYYKYYKHYKSYIEESSRQREKDEEEFTAEQK